MITYNQERFISRAIESVLNQRVNFEYEIIVAEDCSTDRTRELVLDYHDRRPDKITLLLRERNLGAIPNFMGAVAACQGEYVALLEGDDYWTCDTKLQRQVDFLDAHPDFAISCHRAQVLDRLRTNGESTFPSDAAGAYTLDDLLKGNFIMTCTAVYRRDSVGELPKWLNEMKLGDWPLMALAAQSGKIHLMDDVMAVYRVHSGGIWSSRTQTERLRESIRLLTSLDAELAFRYTRTIRETIAHFFLDLAVIARGERNRKETAQGLFSCVRNGGWHVRGRRRLLAGLVAYVLIGSWYKVFSRAKAMTRTSQ